MLLSVRGWEGGLNVNIAIGGPFGRIYEFGHVSLKTRLRESRWKLFRIVYILIWRQI